MDAKKTTRADLNNKRSLFFSIGLVLSMSLVISAFKWKQYDHPQKDLLTANTEIFEEILDIPPTEIPPPPPQQILLQPQIVEVPNDEALKEEIEVTFDAEITEDTKMQQVTIVDAPREVEKEEIDEIFVVVEQSASPKNGMAAFYKEIGEKIKYPAMARRMGIEGKVFIQFVVDKDGSLTDVVAVKGIGAGCDEEAIRVVQEASKWAPAKQRGRPVKQRMVLPIIFKMKQ